MVFIDGKDIEADKQYPRSVPILQPCSRKHSDIEYLWEITLGKKGGDYSIRCFKIAMDWKNGTIKSSKEVKDWKKLAKKGQ
jgi:hypothetical protein